MAYSVHEPARRPGRPDSGTRTPTGPLGTHVRSGKLATYRPGVSARPHGPPATKPVDLWRPVFRPAAKTPIGQPHVVDPGHHHRHWGDSSCRRHRRLRRAPAFRSPVDHHVPADRFRAVYFAGEYPD